MKYTKRLLSVGFWVAVIMCVAAFAAPGRHPVDIEQTPAAEEVQQALPTATPEPVQPDPLADDKVVLAKTVWGEARGCDATQQAAVVWCVLNRYDSGEPYWAECKTIRDVAMQPGQFVGYRPRNPVDDDIYALVEDVLERWADEKAGYTDVGRVLPKEYLFFTGNGTVNIFTTEWKGGKTWDWSLPSPYEEGTK